MNLVSLQSQNHSYSSTDCALAIYVSVYLLLCLESKMALIFLARPVYKSIKSGLHTQGFLCNIFFWVAGIRSKLTVRGPSCLLELLHRANET